MSLSVSVRQQALAALLEADPDAKMKAVHCLWAKVEPLDDDSELANALGIDDVLMIDESTLPGRPELPRLIPPSEVPHRSPFTPDGLAALLHAIAHIEFNAINLALDAVWRFAGMPAAFYRDWMRVAHEEATHFSLLRDELRLLGHDYGDCPAHDGLWEMCIKTRGDIVARMALVPRTLEARGLDATPLIQARLRKVGNPAALRAIDALNIILRDEVGHVAIGNHWYGWLCQQEHLDPLAHYRVLARRHEAPRPRPPFNEDARHRAGFSPDEMAYLYSHG
jgi:uncharacterized ferritin-like protein (DUF455 family)